MDKFKKSIFDSEQLLFQKSKNIESFLSSEKNTLYEKESILITNIVKNLEHFLPRDTFSCKHGLLIYSFNHVDTNRELYISPDVYLVEGGNVVYEVLNHKKYYAVTTNKILISKDNTYFCEIPLTQFLQYVKAEDIINYIEKILNRDYEELLLIKKRKQFLEDFAK